MRRWNLTEQKNVENKKIDTFLEALFKLYKEHGLSIAHEDSHGGFIIENYDEANMKWMSQAHDDTNPPQQ